jgi:uncharacterized protein DUF4150
VSKPIAPATGIAFAFPDVCLTPAAPSPIPIPYPNIAQLDQATGVSDSGGGLLIGPSSRPALLLGSEVATSTGDEGGTAGGGVTSGTIKGKCTVTQASTSVLYGGKGIARFLDPTSQNNNNAQGMLLSAFPTVLVGD